jgi:hypothetical protein
MGRRCMHVGAAALSCCGNLSLPWPSAGSDDGRAQPVRIGLPLGQPCEPLSVAKDTSTLPFPVVQGLLRVGSAPGLAGWESHFPTPVE